jgi:hypothetical protein
MSAVAASWERPDDRGDAGDISNLSPATEIYVSFFESQIGGEKKSSLGGGGGGGGEKDLSQRREGAKGNAGRKCTGLLSMIPPRLCEKLT